MTDLLEVLPQFETKPFTHLFHSLEKNNITVVDLITLDPKEIARQCPLPFADVQKLCHSVVSALQDQVKNATKKKRNIIAGNDESLVKGVRNTGFKRLETVADTKKPAGTSASATQSSDEPSTVYPSVQNQKLRTLDPEIDQALRGGFPCGHITEIVGESAVGKTQFALGLLLTVQLPPPQGLGRSAMYISTEDRLNTKRLFEILHTHPFYQNLESNEKPTMDQIHAITVNDLEAQEHVIRYQVPIAVPRLNVGLIVMDSVAANFRAERETRTPAGLAERATELNNLGNMLRRVAIDHNIVVIVTNQVSDRFDEHAPGQGQAVKGNRFPGHHTSSPAATTPSTPAVSNSTQLSQTIRYRRMETQSLDHQLRFFSGWGSDSPPGARRNEKMKNPALGLAWASQLSARVVLKMDGERYQYVRNSNEGNIWREKKKKRSFAVVFAPWAPTTDVPISYEITAQGIVSVKEDDHRIHDDDYESLQQDYPDLMNPDFWADDDEFP